MYNCYYYYYYYLATYHHTRTLWSLSFHCRIALLMTSTPYPVGIDDINHPSNYQSINHSSFNHCSLVLGVNFSKPETYDRRDIMFSCPVFENRFVDKHCHTLSTLTYSFNTYNY